MNRRNRSSKHYHFLFPENVKLKPDLDNSRSLSSMERISILYDLFRDDFSAAESQIQTEWRSMLSVAANSTGSDDIGNCKSLGDVVL